MNFNNRKKRVNIILFVLFLSVISVVACASEKNAESGENMESHIHHFSEATCTEATRCSCGETKGTALGHDLADGICTVCGITPEYNIGNLLILGDSISTFEGYIPEHYETWYMPSGNDNTDVTDVSQTWWSIFQRNTNANIIRNDSFSGTTICDTGYGGVINRATSFIGRLDYMLAGRGFFKENEIDTVIVFGGTNDSWAGSPIGEVKYSDWTDDDKLSVLPAFCYLINRIQAILPDADVVCVINEGLRTEITEGMSDICETYGVQNIVLSGIATSDGHPTVAGMIEIEKQIRRVFEEKQISP